MQLLCAGRACGSKSAQSARLQVKTARPLKVQVRSSLLGRLRPQRLQMTFRMCSHRSPYPTFHSQASRSTCLSSTNSRPCPPDQVLDQVPFRMCSHRSPCPTFHSQASRSTSLSSTNSRPCPPGQVLDQVPFRMCSRRSPCPTFHSQASRSICPSSTNSRPCQQEKVVQEVRVLVQELGVRCR